MKLSDVKDKIDAYYDNLNPTDFIRHLESLGYDFEPVVDEYKSRCCSPFRCVSIRRRPIFYKKGKAGKELKWPGWACLTA